MTLDLLQLTEKVKALAIEAGGFIREERNRFNRNAVEKNHFEMVARATVSLLVGKSATSSAKKCAFKVCRTTGIALRQHFIYAEPQRNSLLVAGDDAHLFQKFKCPVSHTVENKLVPAAEHIQLRVYPLNIERKYLFDYFDDIACSLLVFGDYLKAELAAA